MTERISFRSLNQCYTSILLVYLWLQILVLLKKSMPSAYGRPCVRTRVHTQDPARFCVTQRMPIMIFSHLTTGNMEWWLLSCLFVAVNCQDSFLPSHLGYCSKLKISDLGSNTTLSREGLVSKSIDLNFGPEVRIIDFNVICEVPGYFRNTIGGVSVIVFFECNGDQSCTHFLNPDDNPIKSFQTFQFGFVCFAQTNGNQNSTFQDNQDSVERNPIATLTTPAKQPGCARCTIHPSADDTFQCRSK